MKIMIVNSKISKNSKQFWEGSDFDFILYFVTAYIIWESTLYMQHEHRVKHQIHYASLEEVSKKNYDKQFTTVTTYKHVQNYTQWKM